VIALNPAFAESFALLASPRNNALSLCRCSRRLAAMWVDRDDTLTLTLLADKMI